MSKVKFSLPFSVFANTFYQGIGKMVVVFFGLLTTILLTRNLGVLGFGQFNLIIAYVTFAAIFADFGLGVVLTKEAVLRKATDDFINVIFTLRVILSLVTLSIFVLVSFFLPYPQTVKLGILIYSFGNFLLLVYGIFSSFFLAELRMEKHLIAQASGSLLSLLATFLFIIWGLSLPWLIFAQVIGCVAIFLAGKNLFGKKITFHWEKSLLIRIFHQSWPLFLSTVISMVYFRADILILSFFKNPQILPDVGIYSISFRIFEVLIVFGTFFSNAIFPIMVKQVDKQNLKKIINEALLLSSLIGIVSILGIVFLAKLIIIIVGGREFIDATLPLQILSISFATSLFINIYYGLVIVLNKQKFLVLVGMIALVFNIAANFIFVPQFSYLASSLINVATSFIILTGYMLVIHRETRVNI